MSPPPTAVADAALLSPAASAPPRAAPVLRDGTTIGILCIVASTLFFSIGDVAAKFMTEEVDPLQVTWFRFAVFLVLIPVVLAMRGPGVLIPRRPLLQIARGASVCVASVFFIVGLELLPVAENTAIAFLGPLFVTALSIPLLGEVVGVRRWAATLVGFFGVMLIVRPGTDAFQLAALLPMAAALVGAMATVLARKMADDLPETTLVWTGVVGFLMMSVMMPWVWEAPSGEMIGWGIANGVFSTIGHILVVVGFRHAAASILAPFSYTQLFFAGVFAFLAFGNLPGVWTIVGILIIAASGLYTAHRERVHGVRRGPLTAPAIEVSSPRA